MVVVWLTLEYLLKVRKLVRVDRSKVCLDSTVDLVVLIYYDSELKICKNCVFSCVSNFALLWHMVMFKQRTVKMKIA